MGRLLASLDRRPPRKQREREKKKELLAANQGLSLTSYSLLNREDLITIYRNILRPILFQGDPETVHQLVMAALDHLPCPLVAKLFGVDAAPNLGVEIAGLTFNHPIGLAAGFDKDAEHLSGLGACGFSHIEVGTVTWQPQPGNERPRIFRFPAQEALVNRMGFPSKGSAYVLTKLLHWRSGNSTNNMIVGVNIGKNKETALTQAAEEYVELFKRLVKVSSYIAINVSSPNTPGLRQLQEKSFLTDIIAGISAANTEQKPLFVKISPDLTTTAIDEVIELTVSYKLAGIIATNTTISRPGVPATESVSGGLSGKPLRELSLQTIRHLGRQFKEISRSTGEPPPVIVGVGGISTSEDVITTLRCGASLVQVYSALILEGPRLVRNLVQGLVDHLQREKIKSVTELVGADLR